MSSIIITLAVPDKTGASRMVCQFASALILAGHQVVIVHGPEPEGLDRSIVPTLRNIGATLVLEPGLAFPVNPLLSKRVSHVAKAHGAACAIGVNQRDRSVALSAARRIQIPGLICAQNQHTFWGRWPVPLLKEAYYANSMRNNADLIICTSEAVQNEFVKRYGVQQERTCCLSNGIDVHGFPKYSASDLQQTRKSFGFGDDELMLINVGRIDHQKGLDILVDSFRNVDPSVPARLIQIGDVTDGAAMNRGLAYREKLNRMVKDLGLEQRIKFMGWRDDIPRILQAADIYVHSARWEGSPLAVIEAMAARLAIVTPNNTSRPAGFNDGEHGLVAEPQCPKQLAATINRMFSMTRDQRQELGLAARSLAENHYDISVISKKFVVLVEAAIARTATTAH